jgi:hypothetical protein
MLLLMRLQRNKKSNYHINADRHDISVAIQIKIPQLRRSEKDKRKKHNDKKRDFQLVEPHGCAALLIENPHT